MSINFLERKSSLVLSSEVPDEPEQFSDEKDDTHCGIGRFYPSWLQRFNTPKAFLVNNGLLGLLNGATFTYFIGCISTLEKRYAFESKITGIIMIGEEISPICFGFLIGYFGGKSHRPRFIAIALMVGFLSSFVMASPYFLYGAIRDVSALDQYKNKTDFEVCDSSEKKYFCDKFPTITAVSLFFVGTFMKGFACNAFYTIGTPYLDDNVKKKNTAMYFAFSMIIQLLGPASGFLLSSFCLQFYEDPFYDPGYSPEDPRWIGAWWLGYVIIGILMLTFSLPMWLFPRRFPGVKAPEKSHHKDNSSSKTGTLGKMADIVRRLISNPILICNQLAGIFRVNGIVGYFVLMPKYFEMQFKKSASEANLFSGPVNILGMIFGILIGGALVKRFRPRARVLTGGIAVAESFTFIAIVICMSISCPAIYTEKETSFSDSLMNLENDCNQECLCTTKFYTPICGPDKKTTYFSPCHAGCRSFVKGEGEDKKEVFTECKCVHDTDEYSASDQATRGYCNFECQWLIVYIAVMTIGRFLSSFTGVPNALVILRCVNPEDKSVAMGALSGLYSILAFLPYPILYGALSDSSCLVWEESCGKTGNCWVYDIDKFRYLLHGVSALFIIAGSCMDIMVWYLSPRLKNLYSDEEPPNSGGEELNTTHSKNLEKNGKTNFVQNEVVLMNKVKGGEESEINYAMEQVDDTDRVKTECVTKETSSF